MPESTSPASTPTTDSFSLPQHLSSSALPPTADMTPTMTATTTQWRSSNLARSMSHASKERLSHYSTGSAPSKSPPSSQHLHLLTSTLSYTCVRDFAYPLSHPMHHGPPPPHPSSPPSGMTTPVSESQRLSDPPASFEQRMPWDSWTADGFSRSCDAPPFQFGDGPPYSEDEDLQSPVVATRHRKHKSNSASLNTDRPRSGRGADAQPSHVLDSSNYDSERGYLVHRSGDGSERYYVNQGGEANGPGGELVTYPPDHARHSRAFHFAQQLGGNEGYASDDYSSPSSPGCHDADQSRYSRDYQFTITSPDEEFHGKAVALFDFERENENELPLVEGQIIWVSYRHGQGWLVAEDPKTQENGLVPEEYVRLLRDIEGGMNSLTGQLGDGSGSPHEAGTPTQTEHGVPEGHHRNISNTTNGYHQPVVSIFSTSSKDLNPYPTEQLGIQAGQTPPQVVHYHGQRGGSQANTPTLSQHSDLGALRRGSQDSCNRDEAENSSATEESGTKAASSAAQTAEAKTEANR
ncbi:hypothetical protein CDD81_4449 [Ophiocordyceps australis]|uniref:SH3 domain-containing protein n=1 Tax=Ophiocordyceps australis TaxID=1399860 RepID=A0A2C5YJ86_9HYPO|nr:hypothetical protein CDD81_4449 [Ophiocordyceps australis]